MNIKKSSLIVLALLAAVSLQAQYFGRNKPRYEQIEYRVHQTPHFEIYHYLDNDTLLHALAEQSERWYRIHQAVLQDTIFKLMLGHYSRLTQNTKPLKPTFDERLMSILEEFLK